MEVALCRRWRDQELRLLDPELVVPVGGLAIRELLGIGNLAESVGRTFPLGGATAIPLPHPSGASGWLNAPANRTQLDAALALIREALGALDATSSHL
jgi:uracil-DNA glycosylase